MTNELEKVELPLMWNIIESEKFKERTGNVFSKVSSVLKNTLGPFGTTTIIERTGDYHFTKDGWNVLKNIHFSDRIEESILKLIIDIASQVVTRVGDGSTSSVVASSYLYEQLKTLVGKERPKEIIQRLNEAVNKISHEIEKNAILIDREDLTYEDIYRVALISTNGDTAVAGIIQEIYKATKNPDIEYRISTNGAHGYQIIDGYQSSLNALDEVFLTNGDGTGTYNHMTTLLFDHRIDLNTHIDFINDVIRQSNGEGRPIFIAAHGFDKQMLEWIKNTTNAAIRGNAPFALVTGYAKILNNIDHQMYHDLASLTGGEVVTEATIASYNQMEYKKIEGTEEQELVRVNPDMDGYNYAGYVNTITLGRDVSIFSGFPQVNTAMLEINKRDALSKLALLEEKEATYGTVNLDISRSRDRVSRLSCKVGIFNVGGHSSLERTSEKDLVEDAIKACSSAFKHGYTVGNNLSIQIAIRHILEDSSLDELDREIYALISKAFDSVLKDVYSNWNSPNYNVDELLEEVKDRAFNTNQTFDLVTEQYSSNVINPVRTDIEILHGAISIIAMVINSNQYISSTPEFLVQ